ncbi:MAG: 2-hydroxyacid dehydrogenase [Geminicoccaceae bacterium]
MRVLVDFPWANSEEWLAELRRQAPGVDLHQWPDVGEAGGIDAAVVWTPPRDFFRGLKNLKAIIVPGAGVDQLWRGGEALPDVPVIRLTDPLMAMRMAEYVLAMVLNHHRQLGVYRGQQARHLWARHHHPDPGDIKVGVMGLGVLGAAAVHHLSAIGYDVAGWSRRPKAIPGVRTFAGDAQFSAFLAASAILVCLLPLTDATRGILNQGTFAALADGAYVINAARGAHLIAPDLLAALEQGKLSGAALDVFEDEPLPASSLLWDHPKITVTPHIASLSNPTTGAGQIVDVLQRLERGEALGYRVDRTAGY